eukprot:12931333-Heterocapsa_arctica.AAC.1
MEMEGAQGAPRSWPARRWAHGGSGSPTPSMPPLGCTCQSSACGAAGSTGGPGGPMVPGPLVNVFLQELAREWVLPGSGPASAEGDWSGL